MTLGRTADNKIKIKSDGGTTRAVECACCGGCAPVCINGRLVSEYIPGSCYYVDSIADPCCNDEGSNDICYSIQVSKNPDGTWQLYGFNFCVAIAPLFNLTSTGTGGSLATATWTGWEESFGYDGQIHDPALFFSQPESGQC